ncbi:MAG TPA: ABC transporter substrate binding protein [Anaeromyxobacteraceae bacterium]|nr:ABC transporter substrate binding protein [Anaeromyxobacteraceae bacterium]
MARVLQLTVRAMLRRGLTAVAVTAALTGAAARADVAVLAQGAVPQYGQVVEGIHAIAPGAAVVDVGDLPALEKLLATPPEVVVAVGARAFEVARSRATRSAVVGAAVLNPDTGGRRDVTAVPIEARPADALEALAALAPGARRIVALHSPDGAQAAEAVRAAAARRPGLKVDLKQVDDIAAFKWVFLGALQDHDAIWLLPDARVARPELVRFMAQACLDRRVALVGFLDGMSRAGALVSVAADLDAIGREAARLAAEVEARPREERRDIPFRHAPGKLYVNDRTRAALGLTGALPPRAEVFR